MSNESLSKISEFGIWLIQWFGDFSKDIKVLQIRTLNSIIRFLVEPDNVLTQWVMNHRKGFVHWRKHCNAWILPHSILDLLYEKDHKNASFTYLAEVHDAESLELLRGLFHYNLVDEFIVYLFPYSIGKGHSVQNILPSRQWQLHKAVAFSNGICRMIYHNPCRM